MDKIVSQVNFAILYHRTTILLEITHNTHSGKKNISKTSFQKWYLISVLEQSHAIV